MTNSNHDEQQRWMDVRTALHMFAESPSDANADKTQKAWDLVQQKVFQSPSAPLRPENSLHQQRERTWDSHRLARLREWRGLGWPINEAVLTSLMNTGKSDIEIAELCGVETADVTNVRREGERTMLTFEDCLSQCHLTEEEIIAIERHEHIPEIAALELAEYLVQSPDGRLRIKAIIFDEIDLASRKGHNEEALKLKAVLKHFIDTHPENPNTK